MALVMTKTVSPTTGVIANPANELVSASGKNPQSSQLAESFAQLTLSAVALNAQTVRLTKVVDSLDEALRKLNLGVSAWVPVTVWSGEDNEHEDELLGYAKLKGGWGLALQTVSGNYACPDRDESTIWAFSDAKREMRVRAVRHFPKLIDELDKQAKKLTATLTDENAEAEALAAIITGFAGKTGGA